MEERDRDESDADISAEHNKRQKTRKVELMQRPTQSRTKERLDKFMGDAIRAQEMFSKMHVRLNELSAIVMKTGTDNMDASEMHWLQIEVDNWMSWLRKHRHYATGDDIERVRKLKATLDSLNVRKPAITTFQKGANMTVKFNEFALPDTQHMVILRKGGTYYIDEMEPTSLIDILATAFYQENVGKRAVGFTALQFVRPKAHSVTVVIDPVTRVIEYYDPNSWDSMEKGYYWEEGIDMWKAIRDVWIPLFNGTYHHDEFSQGAIVALMEQGGWPVGGWKIVNPWKYSNAPDRTQEGGFCCNYAYIYLRLRSEGKSMKEAASHLAQPAFACGSVAKVAMGKDPKTWAARTHTRRCRRRRIRTTIKRRSKRR